MPVANTRKTLSEVRFLHPVYIRGLQFPSYASRNREHLNVRAYLNPNSIELVRGEDSIEVPFTNVLWFIRASG